VSKHESDTYYDILGVNSGATQEEIEEAYRELSLQYHPDSGNPNSSSEKLMKINKAHDVLGDPESREVYDRLGHDEYVRLKRASGVDPSTQTNGQQRDDKWDDPKSEKVYESGWILASQRNSSGNKRWVVCTSEGSRFINGSGEVQQNEFFYEDRLTAEHCYQRYIDSQYECSENQRSIDERLSDGWVLLWKPFETDSSAKKWGIFKSTPSREVYLNKGGFPTAREYWFNEKKDALAAYYKRIDREGQSESQNYQERDNTKEGNSKFTIRTSCSRCGAWMTIAQEEYKENQGDVYCSNCLVPFTCSICGETYSGIPENVPSSGDIVCRYCKRKSKKSRNQSAKEANPSPNKSPKSNKNTKSQSEEVLSSQTNRVIQARRESNINADYVLRNSIRYLFITLLGFLGILIGSSYLTYRLDLGGLQFISLFGASLLSAGLISRNFTSREVFDFIFAGTCMYLAVWIFLNSSGQLIIPGAKSLSQAAIAIIVSVSLLIHELSHKAVGLSFTNDSHFRAIYPTNIASVGVAYLFGFLFLLPGGVYSGEVTKRARGSIAAAGPVSNYILAFFFIFIVGMFSESVALVGGLVNGFLASFNLIPFGPLDGAKILKWDNVTYFICVSPIIGAILVLLYSLGII
jgi:curved DNA-binding protein CbpA/Zn-dependent protease